MMKKYRFLLLSVLCFMALDICSQTPEKGVSKELAAQRKANISNVNYDLTFNIPAGQREKVSGLAVVSFNLKSKADVVLDFQGKIDGEVYVEKKKRKVFCSAECRVRWWNAHPYMVNQKAVYHFVCAYCGKEFTAYGNNKRKYCCHACYIKDRFGED